LGRSSAGHRQRAASSGVAPGATSEPKPARGRFPVDVSEQRRLAERFAAAANRGDLDALFEVLDPDVSGDADSGGVIPGAPRRAVFGRSRVAANLPRNVGGLDIEFRAVDVNGEPGVVGMQDGRIVARGRSRERQRADSPHPCDLEPGQARAPRTARLTKFWRRWSGT
jgi:RNA polymerase sigma-70 factor (ECF subfamily)